MVLYEVKVLFSFEWDDKVSILVIWKGRERKQLRQTQVTKTTRDHSHYRLGSGPCLIRVLQDQKSDPFPLS
jgi:hypothetical protein